MKLNIFAVAAFFLPGLMSCSKEEAVFDQIGPSIFIEQPASGQAFERSEPLPVQIEIEENLGLHTYFVWLIEKETGRPHLVDKGHVHARVHRIYQQFPLHELPPGAYELMVEATDHDHNTNRAHQPIQLD